MDNAQGEEQNADTSKRKTCSLSIRVTPYELTWLAEKARAKGCISISEYTRGVLFHLPNPRRQEKELGAQIAHLEKDVQDLRQDIEKLWSRLGE